VAVVIGCNQCRAPLKGPAEPDADSVFACPVCGESDTFDNVRRSIVEFFRESAADELDDTARNTEPITFNETPRPEGDYRFIAWDDGF
jgi:hypothetical protein